MSEDQKYYIDDEAYDEIDITALLRKLFGEWRQLLKWAVIWMFAHPAVMQKPLTIRAGTETARSVSLLQKRNGSTAKNATY